MIEKPSKKPKKKPTRGDLTKKLVSTAKQIVRLRDGNICQHCGTYCEGSNRQASHVRPESAGTSLRWNPINIKILCYHCHLNWWHKNPLEAGKWFREAFPERAAFIESFPNVEKLSMVELEEMLKDLKKQLESYNID